MDTIELNGKILPVSEYREIDGQVVPIIKAVCEETKHADGRIDITVKVPTLELLAIDKKN